MERNIKLLALHNFFTDFKFHSAVLILYFAAITHSYMLAMSVFSLVFVSSAIFELPTGILSDRIGRKYTLFFGSVAATCAALLYAIGNVYWILCVGAVMEGLSRAFYSGNNDALLHDSLSSLNRKKEYGKYLGKVSAMFQAALTIGAVVGSFIAHWSFAWVMWLSVIPQFLCVIVALRVREPEHISKENPNVFAHASSAFKLIMNNEKLKLLSINQILGFGIGEAAFEFKSAFIATLWPVWAIGIAKMLSYTGGGISFWFSGPLIRKFGGLKLMLFESVYNRIINTLSLLFPTVASPAFMSSTSFLYGTTEVASNELMQKEFSDRERATLSSFVSLFGSVFFGIFSVLLGTVADLLSPAGALLFAEACSTVRIGIMFRLYKRKPL